MSVVQKKENNNSSTEKNLINTFIKKTLGAKPWKLEQFNSLQVS